MLYLDTSALVKKYVEEDGSEEVRSCIARHESIATSTITRAEAAATFARAAKGGSLTESGAKAAHQQFIREWKTYIRIRVTEALVAKADDAAWTHRLRGYDAVHLATALEWNHRIGESITVATFDRNLWRAAGEAGLERFPPAL
jgi:predicted nucleic acid-binding protein